MATSTTRATKWRQFGAGVWVFLNSSFGLWLLSALVLSAGTYWVPQWWHRMWQAEEQQAELTKVSREILCRLNAALSQAAEAEAQIAKGSAGVLDDMPQVDLAVELLSADGFPARICNIQSTGQPQTLHTLLTDWQRLAPTSWSWDWIGMKGSKSYTSSEWAVFSLLSPKEDITQLTSDIRAVNANCAKTLTSGAPTSLIWVDERRCRLERFDSAVRSLFMRIERPITDIALQQLNENQSMDIKLNRLVKDIDDNSKRIRDLTNQPEPQGSTN